MFSPAFHPKTHDDVYSFPKSNTTIKCIFLASLKFLDYLPSHGLKIPFKKHIYAHNLAFYGMPSISQRISSGLEGRSTPILQSIQFLRKEGNDPEERTEGK